MINLLITNKVTGYLKNAEVILTVKGNNITTTEDIYSKFTSRCAVESFTIGGYNKKADFLDIKIAIGLLKPTVYVMDQQFNIQQLYALSTLYLCVSYLSENKQRLVPLTS
jgi:tRNA(Phe) wybutosine-synthesizing methylase Tyw3